MIATTRAMYEHYELRARKDLGQHWLRDRKSLRRIIETADIKSIDTIIEIGAGPGVLTPGLCEKAQKVIALEIDERVIPDLEKVAEAYPNLEIRNDDVLNIDLNLLPDKYSVVSNLPYYITSSIIRLFLTAPSRPERMTLTVQKEVAQRIVAKPPKMSILAVSVQLFGKPKICGLIGREAFSPQPNVDSAILQINDIGRDLEKTLDGLSEEQLFKVVRAGFAEKRKQLHNSLAHKLDLSHGQSVELLKAADIAPSRRAETLTVKDWVRLAAHHARG